MKRRSRVRTDSHVRPVDEKSAEPEELDFQFDESDDVFSSRHTFSNADEAWYVCWNYRCNGSIAKPCDYNYAM